MNKGHIKESIRGEGGHLRVTFLGTSGGVPTKFRNVPAITVDMETEVILLECGDGTFRQILRANKFLKKKIDPMKITKILLSHFHGDNVSGLPGLLNAMSIRGRTKEITIFGPVGIQDLVETLKNFGSSKVDFPINTGTITRLSQEKEAFTIKALESDHSCPSLAYSIEEKEKPGRFSVNKAEELNIPKGPFWSQLQDGKTIFLDGKQISPDMVLGPKRNGRKLTYSGDTRPSQNVISLAKGSDILIHDSTYDEGLKDMAIKYHHSTAKEAAEVAAKSKVTMLFLFHISPRYRSKNEITVDDIKIDKTHQPLLIANLLVNEAYQVFKNVKIANDFTSLDVDKDIQYPNDIESAGYLI